MACSLWRWCQGARASSFTRLAAFLSRQAPSSTVWVPPRPGTRQAARRAEFRVAQPGHLAGLPRPYPLAAVASAVPGHPSPCCCEPG